MAAAEETIAQVEAALAQTGAALADATAAQDWGRVQTLTHEHRDTQARLDVLLAQWEALAVN